MYAADDEYMSEAEVRRQIKARFGGEDDGRLSELTIMFGVAVSQVETRKPLSRADQHQESFNLAGRSFYQFNPDWLREMEALNWLFSKQGRADPLLDSHLDFLISECDRIRIRFGLPDDDVLLGLLGQYRLQEADEGQELWAPIEPPVARELTGPLDEHTVVTIRADPTINSKRKRFELIPVAATLFTYYLSRSGGGPLTHDEAISHFESLFCPRHYDGDDPEFPYDLLTYHLDRDQYFRNLRRFSCLLGAPWWQLPAPQLQPPTDTPAAALS